MHRACPWWAPPLLAVQFLTRVPVPGTDALTADQVSAGLVRAVGWFPVVGTLIGTVTAGVAIAATGLWPVVVAVVIALAVEARLTGAFHEDAVADFCDALGGGLAPDDVRRIMKDSRIGSYGAVGLILALGLRAALTVTAMQAMSPVQAAATIIAAATFGRLVVVTLMTMIAPAPEAGGLAKDVTSGVGMRDLLFATLTALPGIVVFAVLLPLPQVVAIGAAGLFLVWFRRLLLRRIGCSTGDCLGFAAYVGQLILLCAATAH